MNDARDSTGGDISLRSYASSRETLKAGDLQCKGKDRVYYSAEMLPLCPRVIIVFFFPICVFKGINKHHSTELAQGA